MLPNDETDRSPFPSGEGEMLTNGWMKIGGTQKLIDELELHRKVVRQIPEWMIYGVWDTPRCPVCQGFQYASAYHQPEGHKDDCPLKAAKELEREREARTAVSPQQDAGG